MDKKTVNQITFYKFDPKKMSSSHEMVSEPQLSVVIPVLDGEDHWKALIKDLPFFPDSTEFLFIGNGNQPTEFEKLVHQFAISGRSHWDRSSTGRAVQMNRGASESHCPYLLFLHSDSRLNEPAVRFLIQSLKSSPDALHYFNLKFHDQSHFLMQLNRWGVFFRSHYLGIPFGDQGLCLKRDLFFELGGYDESVSYGEDHLLVWKARRNRIRLKCTGATIETSSRKYQQQGWLKITATHLVLTVNQAIPQFILLLKERIGSW
ncbi:TIGR04283 family arsenosugar biosynthesis glycosyltransferase [Gimesia aquarii]|uniref:Glycosyl transferase family 2 n=1 Tax=Gimesia aquarii TaxID=2527964 RepID=A0A517VZP6_9PLAN|nr:glycosyltransferase family 2 protein [Gimesia aquarii]QDT98475.1 hypothetical protein V144x_39770 [Gimesia aquarii]